MTETTLFTQLWKKLGGFAIAADINPTYNAYGDLQKLEADMLNGYSCIKYNYSLALR